MRTLGHIAFGLSSGIGLCQFISLGLRMDPASKKPATLDDLLLALLFVGTAALIGLVLFDTKQTPKA